MATKTKKTMKKQKSVLKAQKHVFFCITAKSALLSVLSYCCKSLSCRRFQSWTVACGRPSSWTSSAAF